MDNETKQPDEQAQQVAPVAAKPKRQGWSSNRVLMGMINFLGSFLFLIIVFRVVEVLVSNDNLYTHTPMGAFHALSRASARKALKAELAAAAHGKELKVPADYPPWNDTELKTLGKTYGDIAEYWEMRPRTEAHSDKDCLAKSLLLKPDVADVIYLQALAEFSENVYRARGSRQEGKRPWGAWDAPSQDIVTEAIDRAEALEPDNGAWHLLMAVELVHSADAVGAYGEMELAAMAKDFRMPKLFPSRDYKALYRNLIENPEIAFSGTGYASDLSIVLPVYMRVKDAYKTFPFENANIQGVAEAELRTAFHRAAVRYACADSATLMDSLIAQFCIQTVASAGETSRDPAPPVKQPMEIAQLKERLRLLRTASLGLTVLSMNDDELAEYEKISPSFLATVANMFPWTLLGLSRVGRAFAVKQLAVENENRELVRMFIGPLSNYDYAEPAGSWQKVLEESGKLKSVYFEKLFADAQAKQAGQDGSDGK